MKFRISYAADDTDGRKISRGDFAGLEILAEIKKLVLAYGESGALQTIIIEPR